MTDSSRPTFTEHDWEPVPGLPGQLPDGESILWQGRPGWRGLAQRAMHLRMLVIYFALLSAWRGAALIHDGAAWEEAAVAAAWIVLLGAIPVGILGAYAWFSARETIYTITTRRVVVRTGVALPMTVNVPFALIRSAAVAVQPDGTGDIAIEMTPPHRVSWVALWPHTRSWRITKPQPMLRAVTEPQAVAQILGRALSAAAAMPVRPTSTTTSDRPASQPAATAMA
jgi:hypothetical protein